MAVVTTVVNRRGFASRFEVNRSGNPIRAVDELGHATGYRYDEDGLRVETIHAGGQRELFLYDKKNPIPIYRANLVVHAQFPAPGPDGLAGRS